MVSLHMDTAALTHNLGTHVLKARLTWLGGCEEQIEALVHRYTDNKMMGTAGEAVCMIHCLCIRAAVACEEDKKDWLSQGDASAMSEARK